VELSLEPGGVFPELSSQVSDGLAGGAEFLKHCPGGRVVGLDPDRLADGVLGYEQELVLVRPSQFESLLHHVLS